ncbi:MAG: hypothetical protein JSW08_00760 [archaeon]|nr:MAG: hypothetical protein JSW08_00760 [archaeon]
MCKTGPIIVGHIILVIGIWLLSKGLINNMIKPVLAHPIFWGLILIFAGICAMRCKDYCTCETKPKRKK